MARDNIWLNQDSLAVGFGTRTVVTSGSTRVADNGATEKLYLTIRGEDLADAVSATGDQIVQAPSIPNGAQVLSATIKVSEAFVGATAVLDVGFYDNAGTVVDDDALFSATAVTAIDAAGDEVAGTLKPTVATVGGVKVAASYDTAAFTAGEAVIEVEYTIPS